MVLWLDVVIKLSLSVSVSLTHSLSGTQVVNDVFPPHIAKALLEGKQVRLCLLCAYACVFLLLAACSLRGSRQTVRWPSLDAGGARRLACAGASLRDGFSAGRAGEP